MGEGLNRAFEAARQTRDKISISIFQFTICHEGRGKWKARVRWNGERGIGKFVQYPEGSDLQMPNRAALIGYLKYAYGG